MGNSIIVHLDLPHTHLLRKEESWQTQQQSQRRENATDDNSEERENHEVIRCVFVVRRLSGVPLSGNHRLLQKNIANKTNIIYHTN